MTIASLATPFVKLLSPEAAHLATIKGLKTGIGVPRTNPEKWDLETRLPRSGLVLPNPVGLAAGFDKNAEVFAQMAGFGFGFVECGTVTPKPQPGNPKPRLFRLTKDRAVINRMGFNNDGLDDYADRLSKRPKTKALVGANVGANKDSEDRIADYQIGMGRVWAYADYITINVSSPNTPGLRGLQDPEALKELLTRCGSVANELSGDLPRPVFLKVAPDLDDQAISDICRTVRGPGNWLSGLIVSNTTLARPDSLRSKDKCETGGLSGAPLMVPSTDVLRSFADQLDDEFDLIGVGGIASAEDAYAKLRAGAHAVQLYSALVYEGPALAARINRGLKQLLKRDGLSSISDVVGADLRLP